MTNLQIAKLYLAANAGTTADALDTAITDGSALTAVTALSNDNFLEAAYQAAFGRSVDAEGKAYWGDMMTAGMTQDTVVDALVAAAQDYTGEGYQAVGSTDVIVYDTTVAVSDADAVAAATAIVVVT